MIGAHGLTKRYGTVLAVDRLSFDVTPGAVTGFLGANGSGKSTTLREVAAEGRTVFVSSHLMNEMEQTADRVVIINAGRLVDCVEISELRGWAATVRVVAAEPMDASVLAKVLHRAGATLVGGLAEELTVRGVEPDRIGRLALEHRIALRELAPQASRLEESFLELTAGPSSLAERTEQPA